MGKVRVKLVGEEQEDRVVKKKEKQEKKKVTKAPGLKGGERVVAVGPTLQELEKEEAKPATTEGEKKTESQKVGVSVSAKRTVSKRAHVVSKRYKTNRGLLKKDTSCTLEKAIELLRQFKSARFDETVELHVNVKEKGISGQVVLPHGTGKTTRIKVADPSKDSSQFDKLLQDVEKGTVDFDILIATPSAMPKLAKVARILGPRGLMPNPKAGTITEKPQELIEKFTQGQVNFKTESQAPIVHMSVGKLSFKGNQLGENVSAALSAIGIAKISSVTLKSTMSPGINVDISKLN